MYEGKKGMYDLFTEHYATTELHISDIHRKEIAQFQFGDTGQWHRAQYSRTKTIFRKPDRGSTTGWALLIRCLLHGSKRKSNYKKGPD